jgi:hypothetical protein
MNPLLIAACGAFTAIVLIAARVTRRALVTLTTEEKARLVDEAAQTPVSWFLLAVVLAGAWLAVVFTKPELALTVGPIVLSLFLLLSVSAFAVTYRRYRQVGLPPAFLRAFAVSRVLRLGAAALLFTIILFWLRRVYAAV